MIRKVVGVLAAALLLAGATCVVDQAGSAAAPAASPVATDGAYIPLPIGRVLDTRTGGPAPGFDGALKPHDTRAFPATRLGDLPPASSGGTVLLSVTETGAQAAGYLTLWETNTARPATSSLTFAAHQTVTRLVAVPYGDGISVYNGAPAAAHVIVDSAGYYDATSDDAGAGAAGGLFRGITPVRAFDSRSSRPVASGHPVAVGLTGDGDLPTSGVGAALVDLTAVAPAAAGYLAASADGAASSTSVLNFTAGQTTSNLAVVPLAANGRIEVRNSATRPVQITVDVVGYYLSGTPGAPGATGILRPARVLDTRSGVGAPRGAVGGGRTLSLKVTGRGGVPSAGVGSVVLNVVATGAGAAGYVSVRPHGLAPTRTSSVTFAARSAAADLVVVPVGTGGLVDLAVTTSKDVQVVADVEAYSRPATVLSGRVTDRLGHPVAGVDVQVKATDDPNTDWGAATDAAGRYVVGGTDGHALTVCFDDGYESRALARQCWRDAGNGRPTTAITVPSGSTYVADAALDPGGTISGTVKDGSGRPIQSTETFTTGDWSIGQSGGPPGSYVTGGFSAGPYTVCFGGNAQPGAPYGYVRQCYRNASSEQTSTPVDVTAGRTSADVDAVLRPGGAVSGTVDVASPRGPLPVSATITLADAGGRTYTDSAFGTFDLDALAPGSYSVCAAPTEPFALPGCYQGGASSLVAVSAGAATSGTAVHLAGAGLVTGTVSGPSGPLAGVTVTATSATSPSSVKTATSGATGSYRIGQVPPGDYTVCFHLDGHPDRCYSSDPGTSSTPVTVAVRQTTAGVSATLD